MEAPPPPPPPQQPPKKKPPQSTQPETAEDGQTLFDDELDRLLPVGTVASVMRAAIPREAKIGRDAREAAQDCASEFVAFVASWASTARPLLSRPSCRRVLKKEEERTRSSELKG